MTQSRTHYIPVSGITIDMIKDVVKDALPEIDGVSIDPAVYCPANGYIVPPDPAVLCPAVGYYDPNLPLPYIPPGGISVETPVADDWIMLVCSNQYDGAINFRCTTSSGQYRTEVYDLSNNLITTLLTNSNTTRFYAFDPTTGTAGSDGNRYYKVIISPATSGQNLLTFSTMTLTGYAGYSWPIIEAHFNASLLSHLVDAFLNQRSLKFIKFYCDVNSLTSLYQVTGGCVNLEVFDMDVSASSLINIQVAWQTTPKLEYVKLPASLLSLTNAQAAFQNSGIKSNPFPSSLPEMVNMSLAMFGCKNLKGTITLPSMPKVTSLVNVVSSCENITKLIFISDTIGLSISTMAKDCINLQEIVLKGTWENASSIIRFIENCPALRKIDFSAVLTGTHPSSFDPTNGTLKWTPINEVTWPTFAGTGSLIINLIFHNFSSFIVPTLKPSSVALGASSSRPALIQQIDIDWTNMSGNNISLRYGSLPDTELNRISTLLPTVASGTFDVRNNPGYATFDRTIVQAKGWTVT